MYCKNLCLFLAALAISACTSVNNSRTVYYSLNEPDGKSANLGIAVSPFSGYMQFEKNMAYAVTANGIVLDDYNNWIQPPDVLLTIYFTLMLDNPGKPRSGLDMSDLKLSGYVHKLECNTVSGEISLAIQFTVTGKDSKILLDKIYSRQAKPDKLTASAYASTISDEAGSIAVQLIDDIEKSVTK